MKRDKVPQPSPGYLMAIRLVIALARKTAAWAKKVEQKAGASSLKEWLEECDNKAIAAVAKTARTKKRKESEKKKFQEALRFAKTTAQPKKGITLIDVTVVDMSYDRALAAARAWLDAETAHAAALTKVLQLVAVVMD